MSTLRNSLKILKRLPRYARPIFKYTTPRKIRNILRAELAMRLRKVKLKSRPYYFAIDICTVCNLRCPLCPTGRETLARQQGTMSFEEYKTIFDKLKDDALVINLYNHGEPMLNKDVIKIIEYSHQNRVATNVSSNFNWPIPIDPEDIVRSGLDYITISLDGVTQEAYAKYRVHGNISEVEKNVKALLAARKRLGSDRPFMEWQFVVFKHNEHEIELARAKAAEWGVDLFRLVSPGVPIEHTFENELANHWMPQGQRHLERDPRRAHERGYILDQPCYYLYRFMSVYPGGGVSPCDFAHDRNHDFGNLLEQDVDEIWNNDTYMSARQLFRSDGMSSDRQKVICDTCPMFKHEAQDQRVLVPLDLSYDQHENASV